MAIGGSLIKGSTDMLLLRLLSEQEMYGYQMIEELERRSDNMFALKAGTLYPLLHMLEQRGAVTSYEKSVDSARVRKYYRITSTGRRILQEKQAEWKRFSSTVNDVMGGGTLAAV